MTDLVAFFDAAGSQSDAKDAIFVSGFVSTVDRWARFESCWLTLLHEHEIKPPFHMVDFANGVNQYECWKENKERRARFLTKAVDITVRNVLWSFSSGIILPDYTAVNADFALSESQGGPYAMCAMGTTHRLVLWQKKRGIESSRAVFEDGDNGRGDFVERFRAIAGHSPRLAKKGEFHALAAADMLAYEHAKLVRDVHRGRTTRIEDIRVPFQRFEGHKQLSWGYHSKQSLLDLVRAANIQSR